jgi:hypothetical protein
MKISRNDPYDSNLCIRGLGVLLTQMHSDLYEYTYFLTFKKSMKSYAKDFNDPWEQSIEDLNFFEKIEDPFVQNCLEAQMKLIHCKAELTLRFGIDEVEDLEDPLMLVQALRFRPYILVFKRSKSYKKLKLYYERSLAEFIESLYFYACTLTAESYKIPLVLKKRFVLPNEESFRLLNHDDHTVELLTELIIGLKKDLTDLRLLMKK